MFSLQNYVIVLFVFFHYSLFSKFTLWFNALSKDTESELVIPVKFTSNYLNCVLLVVGYIYLCSTNFEIQAQISPVSIKYEYKAFPINFLLKIQGE
jgi:hypothetical protein